MTAVASFPGFTRALVLRPLSDWSEYEPRVKPRNEVMTAAHARP